jgi:transcriptional regulator with XRE-family HTH domain
MSGAKEGSTEGERLRPLGLKLHQSQEELARQAGVTTPVFNPRLETLRAVADALGATVRICWAALV